MTVSIPKVARIIQTACPALFVLWFALMYTSQVAEAETHMGPPDYLPLAFFVIAFSCLFSLPALLLWIWKIAGWAMSILFDGLVALGAAYLVAFDIITRKPAPIAFDLIVLLVGACFGALATAFVSQQSRLFFGFSSPSNEWL